MIYAVGTVLYALSSSTIGQDLQAVSLELRASR